jgi:hypothetical protein
MKNNELDFRGGCVMRENRGFIISQIKLSLSLMVYVIRYAILYERILVL